MERRLEAPNHTQIPNAILDNMGAFNDGELRLVLAVARKTFGWHKERDELSFSQLMALTGMRRPMVNRAIKSLLARNILERTPSGKQGFAYRLCIVEITSSLRELVPSGNQFAEETGTSSLSEPELVPSGNPQKKDKEKKEMGTAPTARPASQQQITQVAFEEPACSDCEEAFESERAAPKARTRAPRKRDLIFEALAEVTFFDSDVGSQKQRGAINQFVGKLRKQGTDKGKTEEEIAETIRYVARYFRTQDWRGKRGDAVTVAFLQDVWGAAIAARPSKSAPPTPPAPEPEQRRATRADWERAAQQVEREGREVPAFLKRYLADGAAAQTA